MPLSRLNICKHFNVIPSIKVHLSLRLLLKFDLTMTTKRCQPKLTLKLPLKSDSSTKLMMVMIPRLIQKRQLRFVIKYLSTPRSGVICSNKVIWKSVCLLNRSIHGCLKTPKLRSIFMRLSFNKLKLGIRLLSKFCFYN